MKRYCEVEQENVEVTAIVDGGTTIYGHLTETLPHTVEGWPLVPNGSTWALGKVADPRVYTIDADGPTP